MSSKFLRFTILQNHDQLVLQKCPSAVDIHLHAAGNYGFGRFLLVKIFCN